MHMFIGYFFKGTPNSEVSRGTKAILRVQENNENGNPRDQDRELFIFFKHACDSYLYANFSIGIRIFRLKGDKIHVKGPGEQWERQPQGPGQGVIHFFLNMHIKYSNFLMGIRISRLLKSDKGHIEGLGEQRERQPQGPGQGVVHFFKYECDTCSYANFSMGIRILWLQGWQRPYRGSRRTTRTATPGTRTGSSSFFSNIHMIHVYMSIFQWESEFCGYKVDKGNIKGPGEQREQQPKGPGQGVVHFFQIYIWYMFICQFFNGNPNFEVTSVTKAISRVQGNNENGNPRDQDRE